MKVEKIKFEINGMTCSHCAETISQKISQLDGIISHKINYREKTGEFVFDANRLKKSKIVEVVHATKQYKIVGEIGTRQMVDPRYDLIIIGGGSAAFAAAIKASALKKKVIMINEGLPIGGTCVNVGCVPSKTIIRNAEQFYRAAHPNFSSIKTSGCDLDFKDVIRQKTKLVDKLRKHKYIDVLKNNPNVTILKAYGKLINQHTVEADGRKFSGEKILIATGSSTFIPNISGLNEIAYFTNETLYDLKELPQHLIIIGGRAIALENAQMFSRLGAKVTVLQRSSRILPTEMPDLTESLRAYLQGEGIQIKTGVTIDSVEKIKEKIVVHASSQGTRETIEGTHLFFATGRKGNTLHFGLEEAGIAFHRNHFIQTNAYLQTSVANIYAAGDVTGDYLFVYAAAYEGALAVQNMFTGNQTQKDYSIFPRVIFTDPQVAAIGMDESQAKKNKIDYEASVVHLKDVPRSLAARNTKGFIKLIRNKKTDQLIGARILASEGSELLMEISLAIKSGITVEELKHMFHPYLTLSEGVKLAAIHFDQDLRNLSCCAA